MSEFKSEFDFSKIDMGILSNPKVERLHQDTIAFNQALAESRLSSEEQKKLCQEAQREFDVRWQYMGQSLRLSGHISPANIQDATHMYFDHDTQEYVDNLSVISHGFSTQYINGKMEIGHCFLYDEEPQEVMEGVRIINQVGAWARIEDIILCEEGLTDSQIRENLEQEAPEILMELDEILLNASSVTDAISRLSQFKLYKELSSQHRKPFDWAKFNTKMKIQYIESTFHELKKSIEYYIASQLDMYEPLPYTVHHQGFQNVKNTFQYATTPSKIYMMPVEIVFTPQYAYKDNGRVSIDEDIYIPAIYGYAAFPDSTHYSGYSQYIETSLMMDETFIIESNRPSA